MEAYFTTCKLGRKEMRMVGVRAVQPVLDNVITMAGCCEVAYA